MKAPVLVLAMACLAATGSATSSVRFVHKASGASARISFDGSSLSVPGYCRQSDCELKATQTALDAVKAELAAFKTSEGDAKASIRAEIRSLRATAASRATAEAESKTDAKNARDTQHASVKQSLDDHAAAARQARQAIVDNASRARKTAVESLTKADASVREHVNAESAARKVALDDVRATQADVQAALTESDAVLRHEDVLLHARIDEEVQSRLAGDDADRQLVLSSASQLRAETNQLVDAEVKARKAADTALHGSVQSETIAAVAAEAQARAVAVRAEAALRKAADDLLRSRVEDEATATDEAVTSAKRYADAAIAAESALRVKQQDMLAAAINKERQDRIIAAAKSASAQLLADAVQDGKISQEAEDRKAVLQQERQARQVAVADAVRLLEHSDQQLYGTLTRETQQKINAEASARTEADSLEQEARESLKELLVQESDKRKAAFSAAKDHADRAVAAEAVLRERQTGVLSAAFEEFKNTESSSRAQGDDYLETYVKEQVQVLQKNIGALEDKRKDAVAKLDAARVQAVQRLQDADTAIKNDVSTEVASRKSALTAISAAREAAVEELQRVDNDLRVAGDNLQNDLAQQVASEKAFKARLVFTPPVATTTASPPLSFCQDYAVKKGSTYYAWASPCSGGCSKAEKKMGWRHCTADEFANRPKSKAEFQNKCAASCFDARFNHCDWSNNHVRVENGGYDETILCHSA